MTHNSTGFLQVDPIPGGSANNYDYTNQDPTNQLDLTGTYIPCNNSPGRNCNGGKVGAIVNRSTAPRPLSHRGCGNPFCNLARGAHRVWEDTGGKVVHGTKVAGRWVMQRAKEVDWIHVLGDAGACAVFGAAGASVAAAAAGTVGVGAPAGAAIGCAFGVGYREGVMWIGQYPRSP